MRVSKKIFRPSLLASALASIWIRLGWVNDQKYKDNGWDSYAEKVQFKFLKLQFRLFSRKHMDQLERMVNDVRSSRIFSRHCNKLESDQHRPRTCEMTFKQSGNAGDIIYALPAVRALSNGHPSKLFLKLDVPINGWSEKEHPLGKSGLTAEMARFLQPLLEHQTWLSSIQIYNDETVDYDLDIFRNVPNINNVRGGNIAHWYFWLFAVSADLSQPWLEIRPLPVAHKKIVLARSSRYRNPGINYAFLHAMGEVDFVGTRSEFIEMQQTLPQLRHVECLDSLHLARVIKSARFFIGNQSFPYALAEAVKVPRILEVCPQCPNVIPTGGNAGEAFFQPNFEKLVRHFWEQTCLDAPVERPNCD
jgi:hypothetical protein